MTTAGVNLPLCFL